MSLQNRLQNHAGHDLVRFITKDRRNLIFCNSCFDWVGREYDGDKKNTNIPNGGLSNEAIKYLRQVSDDAKLVRDIIESRFDGFNLGIPFRKNQVEWFVKKLEIDFVKLAMESAVGENQTPEEAKKAFCNLCYLTINNMSNMSEGITDEQTQTTNDS